MQKYSNPLYEKTDIALSTALWSMNSRPAWTTIPGDPTPYFPYFPASYKGLSSKTLFLIFPPIGYSGICLYFQVTVN